MYECVKCLTVSSSSFFGWFYFVKCNGCLFVICLPSLYSVLLCCSNTNFLLRHFHVNVNTVVAQVNRLRKKIKKKKLKKKLKKKIKKKIKKKKKKLKN